MPKALDLIIGGNAQPFESEIRRMEMVAAASGRRITAGFSSASGIHGMAAIVREFTVIGREIAMGRGTGRILGSITLLIQYLRSLASTTSEAAVPARMVADAYEMMAMRSALAARAALRKAQASETAFYADAQESEATLNSAIADRAKATSAEAAAAATRLKAVAAGQAAEAEEAEAAATGAAAGAGSMLLPILAGIAITAGIIYEKFWGLKSIVNEMSMQTPEVKDDYIPLLKRHISDARNAEKELTNEVQKTVDAYNSAAEAAKRRSDETKTHYEHLKKMLDMQRETELAGAKTPKDKEAIQKKYADRELQLLRDRQNEELANKFADLANSNTEAKYKMGQANAIKVNTKEEDQDILRKLNQNAEAAEKFLAGGGIWQEFKKQAAIQSGVTPAEMNDRREAIRLAEEGGTDQANKMIAQRNQFSDKVAANDEIRKQKAELQREAITAAGEAAKLAISMPDFKKNQAQALADATAESSVKLREEAAKAEKPRRNSSVQAVTEREKMGLGAPQVELMPAIRRIETQLRQIVTNTGATAKPDKAHEWHQVPWNRGKF